MQDVKDKFWKIERVWEREREVRIKAQLRGRYDPMTSAGQLSLRCATSMEAQLQSLII